MNSYADLLDNIDGLVFLQAVIILLKVVQQGSSVTILEYGDFALSAIVGCKAFDHEQAITFFQQILLSIDKFQYLRTFAFAMLLLQFGQTRDLQGVLLFGLEMFSEIDISVCSVPDKVFDLVIQKEYLRVLIISGILEFKWNVVCYCEYKTTIIIPLLHIQYKLKPKSNTLIYFELHMPLGRINSFLNSRYLSPLYKYLMNFIQKDSELRAEFDKLNKPAAYGTAGFRDLATNMPYIAFRVGALVAIYNQTQPNKHLGVVISASHNKREDNGVKITNFRGNMLEKDIEPEVERFVNEVSLQTAAAAFKTFLVGKGLTVYESPVTVFIGGDTRPSTEPLLELLGEGIKSQNGQPLNFHLTTTPQLQFYVYLANVTLKKKITDPEEVRSQFWKIFSGYFIKSAEYLGWKEPIQRTVDCANGVGASAMPHFSELIENFIHPELLNTSDDEYLNKECGADYVKTNKLLPRNFQPRAHNSYLSFDGDADRIVFYTEENGKLNLIDGDRTGTVLTQFFNRLATQLRERTQKINNSQLLALFTPVNPTIGFVQTYYANYSSSEYLKLSFGMDPVFAATGVKNLHEKAEHYDIGIYFEANGHGTVIFNDDYLDKLQAVLRNRQLLLESPGLATHPQVLKDLEEYFKFLEFYVSVCRLSNPSVGDAICVFLLFELALFYLKKNYNDTLALYRDLESLTSKIAVKAKENLKVNDIEDKVLEPAGLQNAIEKIIEEHKGKKAFLRASGTENVLRLHVEAETKEQVQAITAQIRELVVQDKILN